MFDDAGVPGGSGKCSLPLDLQRFVDGELPGPAEELIAHHLEGCRVCRAALTDLRALTCFVQDRLGAEDEGEEAASHRILRRVASGLPDGSAGGEGQAARARWRMPLWLGAAAAVFLAFLVSVPFSQRIDASAEKILAESAWRERMWLYQPDKVLHWEVHTRGYGLKNDGNGSATFRFWRRNGDSSFDEITRRYDHSGRLTQGSWRLPDGAMIHYRADAGEVLEIVPSTAALRAALPNMSPASRAGIDRFTATRERLRSLENDGRDILDLLRRPVAAPADGLLDIRREHSAQSGEIYRVTTVREYADQARELARATHEQHIETRTLRRLYLRSTLSYRDGTTGVHESRWSGFQEMLPADFDAQMPTDLLGSLPIRRLTPEDIARRQRAEFSVPRAGTRQ